MERGQKMESITERKIKEIESQIKQVTETPRKELKTKNYSLYFGGTCWGFMGYYITDKQTKWVTVYKEPETAKEYLINKYGKPTTAEKIAQILDYLQSHNKNYTKKQYFLILELAELIRGTKWGQ